MLDLPIAVLCLRHEFKRLGLVGAQLPDARRLEPLGKLGDLVPAVSHNQIERSPAPFRFSGASSLSDLTPRGHPS